MFLFGWEWGGGGGGGGGNASICRRGEEEVLYRSILINQEINVQNWQIERFESFNFLSKNSY